MKTKLTIKKEIPVDFNVRAGNYLYSFNLTEEIVFRDEIREDKITGWGGYYTCRIKDDAIQMFSYNDGYWYNVEPEIQQAYREFLAEKELL